MRAYLPSYELKTALTMDEVLALLSSQPGKWKPIAGGTDVMVSFAAGKLEHKHFVDILQLSGLSTISLNNKTIVIGANTTYSDILASDVMRNTCPLLCAAARETGALAIQNRGTVGGNVMNASPIADSPPSLLAYDAELMFASVRGIRRVKLENFFLGYKKLAAEKDELLTKISFPAPLQHAFHFYHKVGTRRAQSISKLCVAAYIETTNYEINTVRIGLGGVGPTTVRAHHLEQKLSTQTIDSLDDAKLLAAVDKDITTIDDVRSTAHYRRVVTKNIILELLTGLKKHVGLDS